MLFEGMADIQMLFVNTKVRPIFICTTFYTLFQACFSGFSVYYLVDKDHK